MLIRFGAMGPDTYLSGWQAEPIAESEVARRAAKGKFVLKAVHAKAAIQDVTGQMMVILFPCASNVTLGKKPGLVWAEHYLALTPEQFGYTVRESLPTGILDVRTEMLPYWRDQHAKRLMFVAQTPSPYANGPSI